MAKPCSANPLKPPPRFSPPELSSLSPSCLKETPPEPPKMPQDTLTWGRDPAPRRSHVPELLWLLLILWRHRRFLLLRGGEVVVAELSPPCPHFAFFPILPFFFSFPLLFIYFFFFTSAAR